MAELPLTEIHIGVSVKFLRAEGTDLVCRAEFGPRIPRNRAKRAKAAAGFAFLARFRAFRDPNALPMAEHGIANPGPTPSMREFDAHS